jgi:hypothetical protein
MGLIKYVMSLMNGARLGIALQALGIAQAAYNEGLKYALERKQFGKNIIEFPAVYDMLTNDKLDIEISRSLVYYTNKVVDELEALEKILEHKKDELDKDKMKEYRTRMKKLTKKAALFTPLSKYYATEMANKVCYDAIQIHGGTGYMRDFNVERHARDVRITNIYEGTTQLQVVASIGGIVTHGMDDEYEFFRNKAKGHEGEFKDVYQKLSKYEEMFNKAIEYVQGKHEKDYYDYMARSLVDIGLTIWFMYKLLDEAKLSEHKALFARKYAVERLPMVETLYEKIMRGDETTIRNYEQLLEINL